MNIDLVLRAHGIGSAVVKKDEVLPPSVVGLTVNQNTEGSLFNLAWTNPTDKAFSKVEVYMSDTDITNRRYDKVVETTTKLYEGTDTSLTHITVPNQTYYFKVYAVYEVFGAEKQDAGETVSLKALDKKPPANVTDISAVEDETEIRLNWTNPTDVDLARVRIVKNTTLPANETDGDIVYEGLSNTLLLSNLPVETTYNFRFFVYDTNGNINNSETMKITASTITVESVSNLSVSQTIDGESMSLAWTNPTDTTFKTVEVYAATIDLSSKSYAQVVADATKIYDGTGITTSHVTVPNTTYFFKVYSKHDRNGVTKYDKGVSKYLKAVDTKAPAQVSNLLAKEDDKTVTLTWTNPTDKDFSKTTVLYQIGSYPESKNQGALAYQGTGTTVTIDNLTNETKYYFSVFTEDTNGNVGLAKQITATPADVRVYGVKIDTTNSNPETALTYTDNAVGFTPAKMGTTTFNYGSWENVYPFNQIKPCVVKNGVVQYYLNPNDYSKKADGTTADITSGNDGDVMVELPKIWWNFETVGNNLYVRYATKQKDSTYKCLAHQRGTTEKDKVYISAYLGTEVSSKLRSLSGKTPTGNKTIGAFRTLAQANGVGYDQMAYYQLLMLQVLYIVMFKDRDSQIALGRGYVDGNSAASTTGNLNTKGLFYGETTGKKQMKFCGVEDFYGNMLYWIDGIFSDASRNMLINNQSFNDTGSGYTNYGQGATTDLGGYLNSVQGGTETGFIAKDTSGSATTYYPDYGNLNASRIASFGGSWNYASFAGAFGLRLSNSASGSDSSIGARLMFC